MALVQIPEEARVYPRNPGSRFGTVEDFRRRKEEYSIDLDVDGDVVEVTGYDRSMDIAGSIDGLSLGELIDLHERIKARLPEHKLKDIDPERELVLQFMRVKELQAETLANPETAANQKAQVVNSLVSILSQITKMQESLHTAERLKTIEGLLIRHLKTLPLDVVEKFLAEYEEIIKNVK